MEQQTRQSDGVLGWEDLERRERSGRAWRDKLTLSREERHGMVVSLIVFLALLAVSFFLASRRAFGGSGRLQLIGWVVLLAVLFEFLDTSAGMGFGTAITPLLFLLGYSPLQVVPVIMFEQCVAGFIAAHMHTRFGHARFTVKPMSDTVKLVMILAVSGALATMISTLGVYALFDLDEKWIKLYVSILLIGMGLTSFLTMKKDTRYRPGRMVFFGALAGFNKGVGGGGYGPVVTVGGLLSGIPVKTMMTLTSLAEGVVCLVSIGVWIFIEISGAADLDLSLLPSMMLGGMLASIGAPYVVKVLPSKFWKILVPAYCCILAVFSFIKLL